MHSWQQSYWLRSVGLRICDIQEAASSRNGWASAPRILIFRSLPWKVICWPTLISNAWRDLYLLTPYLNTYLACHHSKNYITYILRLVHLWFGPYHRPTAVPFTILVLSELHASVVQLQKSGESSDSARHHRATFNFGWSRRLPSSSMHALSAFSIFDSVITWWTTTAFASPFSARRETPFIFLFFYVTHPTPHRTSWTTLLRYRRRYNRTSLGGSASPSRTLCKGRFYSVRKRRNPDTCTTLTARGSGATTSCWTYNLRRSGLCGAWIGYQIRCYAFTSKWPSPSLTTCAGFLRISVLRRNTHLRLVSALHIFI